MANRRKIDRIKVVDGNERLFLVISVKSDGIFTTLTIKKQRLLADPCSQNFTPMMKKSSVKGTCCLTLNLVGYKKSTHKSSK